MADPWAAAGFQDAAPPPPPTQSATQGDPWASSGFLDPDHPAAKAASEGPPPGQILSHEEQSKLPLMDFLKYRFNNPEHELSLLGMAGDIYRGAKNAYWLPSQVLTGEVNPQSPEGMQKAIEAAPFMTPGSPAAGLTSRGAVVQRAIQSQLPDYVTPEVVNGADHLIQDAAGRGVTLTWPEALSQVSGRPVLTDMQRLLESSRQSRATMQESLSNRPQQIQTAGQEATGTIAPPTSTPTAIGPAAGEAAQGVAGDVRGAINDYTDPLYKKAANVLLTPAEMNQVKSLPGYASAAAAVRGDPQLNRYVSSLPENSVGFLNEVKKQLDQQAENATPKVGAANPNMQRAAGLSKDASAVKTTLTNASPDYANAVALQAEGRKRFLDPLMNGPIGKLAKDDITTQKAISALFPDNPLAGSQTEIGTAVSQLAQKNSWAATQLVRAHVAQKLDEAFNAAGRGQEAAQFAGAGAANRLVGSSVVQTQKFQNLQAAIQALPGGQQTWPGVQRFLEIAQATGTRQPIGSKTEFNKLDTEALSNSANISHVAALAASPEKWLSVAHDVWSKWQLGRNLDGLAQVITDPRSGPFFRRLSQLPNVSKARVLAAGFTTSVAKTARVPQMTGQAVQSVVGGNAKQQKPPSNASLAPVQ